MINAVVLINVGKGKTESVAQKLMELPGVSEVYSVAGRFDLVAVLRVKHHEELAAAVADQVQKTPGIERTETLIAFKAYSRHDLESMFGIGIE